MIVKCPRCGRGITAKYRGAPHPQRIARRKGRYMSPAFRRFPCPKVVA